MSYSIYLWHWPVIVFAVALWPASWIAVTAAVLSLIPAYLAYRFVEQPIRLSKIQSPRVIGAAYLVTTVFVVLVAWMVVTLGSRLVPYANAQSQPTLGIQNDCLIADREFQESDIERCRFSVEDAKGWILLAGDSHAESFSNAVINAGNDLGYDVVALTGADCVLVRDNEANGRVDNCAEMAGSLLDEARGIEPPAAVVVAQRGIPVGIRETYEELADSGIPVLRIEGVPQWRPWDATQGPDPCAGGVANASCEISREQVISNAPASKQDEASAIDAISGVTSFDPWPMFCSDSVCSAIVDGKIAYSDASHFNAWGSELFTDRMRTELGALVGSQ